MRIPQEFERYHQRILGGDYRDFIWYFLRPRERLALRVNTLKSSVREVKRVLSERGVDYGPVRWCPEGLWADAPSLDFMEHQLGLYYVQSASSMIAPQILQAGERVLDMCAAPGGKTTHLAQLMGNGGLLAANDDNPGRIKALVYNIQRCGVANALVTKNDACKYSRVGERFDRILLDAPCSSVGTLRHNREILEKWSLAWVRSLATIQKRMILEAYDTLEVGGRLAYTTCTTTVEENEGVVGHLLQERPGARLNRVRLEGLRIARGLTEEAADCGRIWPQDNDTEPHFVAEVVKGG
jgi:NOL1/NOP2/sun family putative RNA methylase